MYQRQFISFVALGYVGVPLADDAQLLIDDEWLATDTSRTVIEFPIPFF